MAHKTRTCIRTIKPELIADSTTVALSDAAWRLFVSAAARLANENGRFHAAPASIATLCQGDAEVALAELVAVQLVRVEGAGDGRVGFVGSWRTHRYFDVWTRGAWDKALYPEVYRRDGPTCRYCGSSGKPMQVDHVVPRCLGGSDELVNLVVACRQCNARKGGRTPEQARMTLRPAPEVVS